MCGPPDDAIPLLSRLSEERQPHVIDSEWMVFVTFVAETALRACHRAAAKYTYEQLAPYKDMFVIDGIGAETGVQLPACWLGSAQLG